MPPRPRAQAPAPAVQLPPSLDVLIGRYSALYAPRKSLLLLQDAVAFVLSANALTSYGSRTITVYPINVLVNGKVFRPTDAGGNEVMVFTYNGTTYVPLRALAEAYGLEVGYDSESNTASVTKPQKTSAGQADAADFASAWTVTEKPVTHYGSEKIFTAVYSGSISKEKFMEWWKSMDLSRIKAEAKKLVAETQELVPGYEVTMYFNYGALSRHCARYE